MSVNTYTLTTKFSITQANAFVEEVKTDHVNYYIFASKSTPWVNANGDNDDTAIVIPNNSYDEMELKPYNEILFGKKIGENDIKFVTKRYDWVSNTIYDSYDNSTELTNKKFYVITLGNSNEYNVYKCIDNANNKPSTIKPIEKTTKSTFKTGDGYTWKYMYTISSSDFENFATNLYIPVIKNANVIGNAIPGTIDCIRVTNTGLGYSVHEKGVLPVIVDNNQVKLPNTSSTLTDFYKNSSIYLKGPFGAGQIREIIAYNGSTKTATLSSNVDIYARLDFADVSFISDGSVGNKVIQIIDSINYLHRVGSISANDTIIQSDNQRTATVLSSNTTVIRVNRTDKNIPFEETIAFRNSNDLGNLKVVKANISNLSNLMLGIVVDAGSGYTSNATIVITSNTGSGAAAVGVANSSGKINSVHISAQGSGYLTEPIINVGAPIAQSFNSNTQVIGGIGEGSNNVIILATANKFTVGDKVKYFVNAGNTVIGGLTNNAQYWIQFANSTVIALSNSSNTAAGNRISLTPSTISETGHNIQGMTAEIRILPRSLYAINASANAFNNEFAVGDFVRIGENANVNIRRVTSVNATHMIVDRRFTNILPSANTFKLNHAFLPISINVSNANGIISNTNLQSVVLKVSNGSSDPAFFIVGEKVQMIDNANVTLLANGTVAYANSTEIFITASQGTWLIGKKVRGDLSQIVADINSIDSRPNVILKNPKGNFIIGEQIQILTPSNANVGVAELISYTDLSTNAVSYEIGPTVKIVGDGEGAEAIARVNANAGNSIFEVVMLNHGKNYTYANVTICSNTMYGSGAKAKAVISPYNGHGSDPFVELCANYVMLKARFNQSLDQDFKFPPHISFRKVGLLKSPLFDNIKIDVAEHNRVSLSINNQVGVWSNNEYITQTNSQATGILYSSNSTVLVIHDVKGTFVTANTVKGLTSNATANVVNISTIDFILNETIEQEVTKATAKIKAKNGNTLDLTDIKGKLRQNYFVIGKSSGAKAKLITIKDMDNVPINADFAETFNQVLRLTLSSFSGNFTNNEVLTQSVTGAKGKIIDNVNDIDFTVTMNSGAFTKGDNILNSNNTLGIGKVLFANSTYLKITKINANGVFNVGNIIYNGLGANATINSVRKVLVVSDIRGNNFVVGSSLITGENTGHQGTISIVSRQSLVKNTGDVLYMESANNVINKNVNTTEEVRLVLKF